ncbi:hypothetical protein Trco_004996 [Trichoderma cornu-damae]|uniref:H-type lectin domain-containing protein n=1 Tax=Trichoderma cornu-damae TaxID=654480 RepID=A0A9P8TUY9_9HYPO|nr:hypothetical protein Trco_004996 [Trichoderma cornu-damae]
MGVAPLNEMWTCGTFEDDSESTNRQSTNDQLDSPTERGFLALDPSAFWETGATIEVSFLTNSDVSERRSQEAAKEVKTIVRAWEDAANIRFVFSDSPDAPVRVQFHNSGDAWTALGTKCYTIGPGKPTMCLVLQQDKRNFQYQVLHEFGHLLGCVHEHSNPNANIDWDKGSVYKYYEVHHQWSKQRTFNEIIRRFGDKEVEYSHFDTSSVMMYPIKPFFIKKGGVGVEDRLNTKLSETDKKFIRRLYPPPTIQEEAGSFYSWNYHGWRRVDRKNTAEVEFDTRSQVKPAIAVGLTEIDLGGKTDLRVEATTPKDLITTSGFTIQTRTWENSVMHSAAATWFKIDNPQTSTYQAGTLDTKLRGVSDRCEMRKQDFEVKFDRAFPTDSPPAVILWLRGFHLGHREVGHREQTQGENLSWGIRLSYDKVTCDSFQLTIEPESGNLLYRAMVTWIAYPKAKIGVFSGVVDSQDLKQVKWGWSKDRRRGYQKFVDLSEAKAAQGCTASDFRVCAGITSFKFTAVDNLRLHADIEKLDGEGDPDSMDKFWVRMWTWNQSDLNKASVSYLAEYR